VTYFDPLQPQYSFLSPPPPTDPPQTVPLVHSCPIIIITITIIIILDLVKICGICHWSLVYLKQRDELQFHLFSCKWHDFILFYV
jgi:hypothetical protein